MPIRSAQLRRQTGEHPALSSPIRHFPRPDSTPRCDFTSPNRLIVDGGVNMPALGAKLKSAEIDDLVAFLQSRRKNQVPAKDEPRPVTNDRD